MSEVLSRAGQEIDRLHRRQLRRDTAENAFQITL